jgi:hypothetical protein
MIEASALMGITVVLFFACLWAIQGSFSYVFNAGPILAALLIFPAFVLWLIFGQVVKNARTITRFLVAIAVVIAIAAFGALLMQPQEQNSQRAFVLLAETIAGYAGSGILAAVITYGILLRESKKPDPTLLTKPIAPSKSKKKKK